MKKVFLLAIVFCVVSNVFCQSNKKNYIGAFYSIGGINYSSVKGNMFSERKYEGKNFYNLGLDYELRLSENVDFCTGFVFSNNKTVFASSHQLVGMSNSYDYDDELFLFSFPIHIKYHFLKFLFIDGGVCFNYHPSRGYTWGLGFGAGVGAEYVFNNNIAVSLSPYTQFNLLNANLEDQMAFMGKNDNLTQFGVKLSLGYRF